MADLVVLGFDNRRIAEEVFELGASLEGDELLDLQDAALAWRDDKGRVRIHQALPTTATGAEVGALSGALWGTLLGLLFLNPLAGASGVAGHAADSELIAASWCWSRYHHSTPAEVDRCFVG